MGTGNYMVDELLQEDFEDYKEWKRKRAEEYYDIFEDYHIEIRREKMRKLERKEGENGK